MDNIKKNYKKLNNVISYINNKYYIGKLYLLIDILFCKIKYKANLNDYKMFSMYLLNNKERKTILTSGKNLILINKLNDYSKLHIFENKNEFNEVFGDYLKRKWMFINRKNYNEFECFIKNMDYIIIRNQTAVSNRLITISRSRRECQPGIRWCVKRLMKRLHIVRTLEALIML